jgi:hypothetical protein
VHRCKRLRCDHVHVSVCAQRNLAFYTAAGLVPLPCSSFYHAIRCVWPVKGLASTRAAVQALGGTLDSLTGRFVAVLRRQPLARLLLVVYLVAVHAFIYVLLGSMQRHVLPDAAAARKAAHGHFTNASHAA